MDSYYDEKMKEMEKRYANEEKERTRLISVCNEALRMKKFERGYYGPGKTACNMAAAFILDSMGYYTQFMRGWWEAKKIFIVSTANSIYAKARKEKALKKINLLEAQRLSWKGIPSLICAKSKKRGISGHVAITYPSPADGILYICNIGWYNLVCPVNDKKSFGGGKHYLTDLDVWRIPLIN